MSESHAGRTRAGPLITNPSLAGEPVVVGALGAEGTLTDGSPESGSNSGVESAGTKSVAGGVDVTASEVAPLPEQPTITSAALTNRGQIFTSASSQTGVATDRACDRFPHRMVSEQ